MTVNAIAVIQPPSGKSKVRQALRGHTPGQFLGCLELPLVRMALLYQVPKVVLRLAECTERRGFSSTSALPQL
jgi:hypothetical protein